MKMQVNTGEYITPDYEVDSHDLAAGLSIEGSSAVEAKI